MTPLQYVLREKQSRINYKNIDLYLDHKAEMIKSPTPTCLKYYYTFMLYVLHHATACPQFIQIF